MQLRFFGLIFALAVLAAACSSNGNTPLAAADPTVASSAHATTAGPVAAGSPYNVSHEGGVATPTPTVPTPSGSPSASSVPTASTAPSASPTATATPTIKPSAVSSAL